MNQDEVDKIQATKASGYSMSNRPVLSTMLSWIIVIFYLL